MASDLVGSIVVRPGVFAGPEYGILRQTVAGAVSLAAAGQQTSQGDSQSRNAYQSQGNSAEKATACQAIGFFRAF